MKRERAEEIAETTTGIQYTLRQPGKAIIELVTAAILLATAEEERHWKELVCCFCGETTIGSRSLIEAIPNRVYICKGCDHLQGEDAAITRAEFFHQERCRVRERGKS